MSLLSALLSSDITQVYDGTAFLQDHPGGAESILLASGMDSSEDFNAIHSAKAKKMLDDYYIGDLDDSAPSKTSVCSPLLQSRTECQQSEMCFCSAESDWRFWLHSVSAMIEHGVKLLHGQQNCPAGMKASQACVIPQDHSCLVCMQCQRRVLHSLSSL